MEKIKTFKGKDGSVLLPRTHAKAVRTDDGKNVQEKLSDLEDEIVRKTSYATSLSTLTDLSINDQGVVESKTSLYQISYAKVEKDVIIDIFVKIGTSGNARTIKVALFNAIPKVGDVGTNLMSVTATQDNPAHITYLCDKEAYVGIYFYGDKASAYYFEKFTTDFSIVKSRIDALEESVQSKADAVEVDYMTKSLYEVRDLVESTSFIPVKYYVPDGENVVWTIATDNGGRIYEIKEGDFCRIKANASNVSYISLVKNKPSANGGDAVVFANGDNRRHVLASGETFTFEAKEDFYLYVYYKNKSGVIYFPSEIELKSFKINQPSHNDNSILSQASYKSDITLLHYTDIHADNIAAEQILRFAKENASYIDDIVCTGDSVLYYGEGTSSSYPDTENVGWWQRCGLAQKSLFVLGNHDCATPESTEFDNKEASAAWNGKGKTWAYQTYFAPYASALGINIPTGECYWHKDYADKRLRIIGLDCMNRYDGGVKVTSQAQEDWLRNVLSQTIDSANPAYGYSVIFLCHYALDDFSGKNEDWNETQHKWVYNRRINGGVVMNERTSQQVNWSVPDFDYSADKRFCMRQRVASSGLYGYEKGENNYIGDIIQSWVDNGGKYVAWLSGHTHFNLFAYPSKYPNLLSISCDQAGNIRGNGTTYDASKREGESYFAFNVVSVDTTNHIIKIVRKGLSLDNRLRSTKYICYDYVAKRVISEG